MSRLKAANNAQTALAALMDASATTCTVVSGDLLPAVPFRASIDNEIIEVGAKSGNTLSSILRGQEGTTAAAHQSGSLVEGKMTAGMHNELLAPTESLTVSQTTAPTGNTGTISQILGYLANRIKAITGKTNWYDVPSKTLEDVNAHIGALVTSESVHGLRIVDGTWTPVLKGGTTPGTNTYSAQSGSYKKIGKLVIVFYQITLSAKDAAMAGGLRIDGLPVAANGVSVGMARVTGVTLRGGFTHVLQLTSGSVLLLLLGGGTWDNLLPADISDTTEILGSMFYTTA